jgi:hypothetical protein
MNLAANGLIGASSKLVLALALVCAPGVIVAGIGSRPRIVGVEAPQRLADTGLYSSIESHQIAVDVLPFTPQYPLWTDGASKRRWIHLPANASIDGSNVDAWDFPIGTKVWKEFSFGGRRVETRYIERAADGRWIFAAYQWSADEREAQLAPARGARAVCETIAGARHDIPAVQDCGACHEAGPSRVLGFSALQLSNDRDPLAPHAEGRQANEIDLRSLIARGSLRNAPADWSEHPPRIVAGSAKERAALGYLHANCGMCHNSGGALAGLALDLDLSYSLRDGERTPGAELTTFARESNYRLPGESESLRVDPGHPEHSVLYRRMATRFPAMQMPPLGTHAVDADALALIAEWITDPSTACQQRRCSSSTVSHNHN